MNRTTKPAYPEDGTNLIIITHAPSDVSKMVAALDEQLKYLRAFCRGLDENEYHVTLYDYAGDRQIYTEHSSIGTLSLQKKPDQYPLIFIDEELVWSSTYPITDELADLLKIGCRDHDDSSDCCRLSCCRIRQRDGGYHDDDSSIAGCR